MRQTHAVCCSDVDFAEVDFPAAVQPRLVMEYLDGLKIIVLKDRFKRQTNKRLPAQSKVSSLALATPFIVLPLLPPLPNAVKILQ